MQYIMNILAHCIVCSVGNRSSIPGFFFFVGGRGEGGATLILVSRAMT